MARFGSNLLKEKSGVGVTTSTTFNSPGTYILPYGKTVVRIGGRGASGNPNSGGTYWYSNPGSSVSIFNVACYYRYYGNPYPFAGGYGVQGSGYGGVTYNGYEPTGYTCYYAYQGSQYSPGQTYYNPYVPGNAASSTNISGIIFPGGNAGSSASIVPQTSTSFKYETTQSISVTVPSGGYVTIDNIGL
jgi:hypothetical protein